jgi:hypothetical protein
MLVYGSGFNLRTTQMPATRKGAQAGERHQAQNPRGWFGNLRNNYRHTKPRTRCHCQRIAPEVIHAAGGHVTAWLLPAMAHYNAGQVGLARDELAEARQWVVERASALDIPQTQFFGAEESSLDQPSTGNLTGGDPLSGTPVQWPDRSTIRYLFLEVVSLIDKTIQSL